MQSSLKDACLYCRNPGQTSRCASVDCFAFCPVDWTFLLAFLRYFGGFWKICDCLLTTCTHTVVVERGVSVLSEISTNPHAMRRDPRHLFVLGQSRGPRFACTLTVLVFCLSCYPRFAGAVSSVVVFGSVSWALLACNRRCCFSKPRGF